MKKYLIILILFLSTVVYSQEGRIKFKVRSNHYYEFDIHLRGDTQYLFKLNGQAIFNFRIIEPSGNEWSLHISDNNELYLKENIMDAGLYKIRVYSISDNIVNMTWEEY